MIRLIATDLDGTLLEEDGSLPEGIYQTIQELSRLGIRFAASSGRQYGNLRRLFGPVADQMAYVCENGSLNIVDGQVAGLIPIENALVHEIISDLEALNMDLLISCRHTCYMLDRNRSYTDDIVYRLRNTITIVSSWAEIHEPIIKISGHTTQGVRQFAPGLLSKWSSYLTATVSGRDWFDFTAANKGLGMEMLMSHMGILPEETMAFGDNFNDETMLDLVGYPFLMEHADHALRKPGVRLCRKVLPVLERLIQAGGDPVKAFEE